MTTYETEHVTIRTFRPDHWQEKQRLAVDREQSPAAGRSRTG